MQNSIINKIGKQLSQIFVIVAGVAITLFSGQWINNKSEKRDLKLYLNSIKMELEEIIPDIESQIIYFEEIKRYSIFLWSYDNKKSIPKDSILDWGGGNIVSSIRYINFPTTAFEMFKISGSMRLMDDKELLRDIWKLYNEIELLQRISDSFNQLKKDYSLKEIEVNLKEKKNDIPLYDFFIFHGNSGLLESNQKIFEKIKEIVSKLDEKYK